MKRILIAALVLFPGLASAQAYLNGATQGPRLPSITLTDAWYMQLIQGSTAVGAANPLNVQDINTAAALLNFNSMATNLSIVAATNQAFLPAISASAQRIPVLSPHDPLVSTVTSGSPVTFFAAIPSGSPDGGGFAYVSLDATGQACFRSTGTAGTSTGGGTICIGAGQQYNFPGTGAAISVNAKSGFSGNIAGERDY
jgi:hypothetical protein